MGIKAILLVFTSLFGASSQMSIESNSSRLFGNSSDTLGLSPSHCVKIHTGQKRLVQRRGGGTSVAEAVDKYGVFTVIDYMNHMCSMQKTLKSRDAILMSPWSSKYPRSSQTCIIGLKNGKDWTYRFVITFKEMDMYGTSFGKCVKSRLDLYDGQTTDQKYRLNGVVGLCGTHNDKHYETSTSFLTMVYSTNALPHVSQYFEAVITPFHRGTCKHDEFKCSNGNCIKNNMLCDSYNNCGDDSDEKNCAKLALAIIIGIVVGCVVFLAVIIGIIACCCCGWCCVACAYESI